MCLEDMKCMQMLVCVLYISRVIQYSDTTINILWYQIGTVTQLLQKFSFFNNNVVCVYIQVHLNKLECRGKVHLFQ